MALRREGNWTGPLPDREEITELTLVYFSSISAKDSFYIPIWTRIVNSEPSKWNSGMLGEPSEKM